MSDQVRLSVNLNEETAGALKKYAADRGISVTEAVRRCVAIADFVSEEQANGRRILTEDTSGRKRREVMMM